MRGYVPFEEKLDVYENKFSKNTVKTMPKGMAENLWGGARELKALPCGVPPMDCWAPPTNTSGHRYFT